LQGALARQQVALVKRNSKEGIFCVELRVATQLQAKDMPILSQNQYITVFSWWAEPTRTKLLSGPGRRPCVSPDHVRTHIVLDSVYENGYHFQK